MVGIFKELCKYRELLKTNIQKDIRGRYKASFLGVLWSFLNPLLQVVVYWIVFPYLFRSAGMSNYLCYLVTGIIPWNFFTTAVNSSTTCINSNAGIIKKVYFPREVLVLSCTLSALVNFFISCAIILVFCVGTGAGISYHLIYLPIVAIIQTIFCLGIGLILSAINVYVRDIENIVAFILNMAFYGTPIIYSLDMFQDAGRLLKLIQKNPLTKIVVAYRDIFLNHQTPDFKALFIVFCLGIIGVVIGYIVFKKLEKGFAEEL